MTWLLQLKNGISHPGPIEARGMVQALSEAKTLGDAAGLQLRAGHEKLSLGELCQIEQADDEMQSVRLVGDFSRWNAIGFGRAHGRVEIVGSAGARTGGELAGGVIEIQGSCGPWAGVAAKSGRLIIHGNAGDWLAAHWPGETRGLTGAEILVHGNAGDHAGARMRRGLLAIAGSAGVGLGRAMVAGSIFVGGTVAGPVGSGMKRGSIVLNRNCSNDQKCILPSFQHAGLFRPLTLDMQLKYLAGLGWLGAVDLLELKQAQRYFGDRLSTGLGELLLLH